MSESARPGERDTCGLLARPSGLWPFARRRRGRLERRPPCLVVSPPAHGPLVPLVRIPHSLAHRPSVPGAAPTVSATRAIRVSTPGTQAVSSPRVEAPSAGTRLRRHAGPGAAIGRVFTFVLPGPAPGPPAPATARAMGRFRVAASDVRFVRFPARRGRRAAEARAHPGIVRPGPRAGGRPHPQGRPA
jgi:hypothetical protein